MKLPEALKAVFALALVSVAITPASAQRAPDHIPADVHDGTPRDSGTSLTFCIDDRAPGSHVDIQIAEIIAQSLLLEPRIFRISEMPGRIDQLAGVTDDLLFVLLDDECDAFLGMQMGDAVRIAEFVTPTRPYYESRYVIASTNPAVTSFNAMRSEGVKVGIPASSRMNSSVAFFYGDTDRRLYRTEAMVLEAMFEGEIEAGMFFGPNLLGMLGGDPGGHGLTLARVDPVPNGNVPVSMLLMEDQVYTRNQIDMAIAALVADGTIASVLEDAGYTRIP